MNRRTFFGRLFGGLAAAAIVPAVVKAQSVLPPVEPQTATMLPTSNVDIGFSNADLPEDPFFTREAMRAAVKRLADDIDAECMRALMHTHGVYNQMASHTHEVISLTPKAPFYVRPTRKGLERDPWNSGWKPFSDD